MQNKYKFWLLVIASSFEGINGFGVLEKSQGKYPKYWKSEGKFTEFLQRKSGNHVVTISQYLDLNTPRVYLEETIQPESTTSRYLSPSLAKLTLNLQISLPPAISWGINPILGNKAFRAGRSSPAARSVRKQEGLFFKCRQTPYPSCRSPGGGGGGAQRDGMHANEVSHVKLITIGSNGQYRRRKRSNLNPSTSV